MAGSAYLRLFLSRLGLWWWSWGYGCWTDLGLVARCRASFTSTPVVEIDTLAGKTLLLSTSIKSTSTSECSWVSKYTLECAELFPCDAYAFDVNAGKRVAPCRWSVCVYVVACWMGWGCLVLCSHALARACACVLGPLEWCHKSCACLFSAC